ncbi:MAG: hypothetical protein WCH34_02225 [Bacteroidota bacterium]
MLKNEKQTAGKHQLVWNTQTLPEGLCYLALKTSDTTQTIRIVKSE